MNDLIPCLGSFAFLFVILTFIVIMRYINYRETLKLAEKGLMKPMRANGNSKAALIWGIIITAMGMALMLGLWPLGIMVGANIPFGFGPWMLAGLLPMFFGMSLLLIHVLTREPQPKDDGNPPAPKVEE